MLITPTKPADEGDDVFQQVSRIPKTSELVADQIRRMIVGGRLGDGDLLQPTNELLQRFGVSRPVLREAFRILESEDLITVRRGSRSGIKVRKPSIETAARVAAITLQSAGATVGELYQARLAFEPYAARLIGERCDPRDITQLRRHLTQLEDLINRKDWPEYAAIWARTHHLLVELTGNRMLALTAGLIANVLERHQRIALRAKGQNGIPVKALTPEERRRGPQSLTKLVRLIEARDAAGAESHWREHLKIANAYWLSAQDQYATIQAYD